MTDHLRIADNDAIRAITLRRPEKKNALTQAMYRGMSEAIDAAQVDPSIRCITISGEAGVFTAGNDLEDFLKDGTSNTGATRASNAVKFLYSLAQNAKPIVAAVDGIASAPRCCSTAITCSPRPPQASRRPSSISAWCRKAPPACWRRARWDISGRSRCW